MISLMTYNIRYDNPNDTPNSWAERKKDVATLIEQYDPDIFGIQEGLIHQVTYLDNQLNGYSYIGVGRDDGKKKGEFSAIFYKNEVFELGTQETFWLSPTPESISVGWDAAMERICTYGQFIYKNTSDTIHIFNTHFDHIGKEARLKSAQLIISRIKSLDPAHPIVLMGDLNALPESPPISAINEVLVDSRENSMREVSGPEGTFNQFDPEFLPQNRIDYIFTNTAVLNNTHIDKRRPDNLWVSDHLPVFATIKLKYGQ